MCMHPFAKEALTLHLARSEGNEHYFVCNLMYHKVLTSSHQHLMAEAPVKLNRMLSGQIRPPCVSTEPLLAATVNCTLVADENCTLGTP